MEYTEGNLNEKKREKAYNNIIYIHIYIYFKSQYTQAGTHSKLSAARVTTFMSTTLLCHLCSGACMCVSVLYINFCIHKISCTYGILNCSRKKRGDCKITAECENV